MRKVILSGVMLTLVLQAQHGWAQCSMCQASLANAENGGVIGSAFNQGILLMLGVMCVLGAIGWRFVSRARAKFKMSSLQEEIAVSVTNSSLPAENPASR